MVPTELLAVQHYEHLLNLLEAMEEDQPKPSIALLTGSTPLKQSRVIRKACIFTLSFALLLILITFEIK